MPDTQDDSGTPLTPTDLSRPLLTSASAGGRSRAFVVLWGSAVSALVVDQATKVWALATLTPGEPVDFLGSAIRLNLVRNPGAAFSIGDGATWMLTVLSVVIIAWVAVVARRVGTRAWAAGLGLLLGGAIGNLVDRVFRAPGPGRGHVVDFIDYSGWFVGNIADIAIVGAAALVATLSWRGVPVSGTSPLREPPDE
ncbi:MAG: signal peptidase II [Dermatophilaceae bacterium]